MRKWNEKIEAIIGWKLTDNRLEVNKMISRELTVWRLAIYLNASGSIRLK